MSGDSIQVGVRVRPFNKREKNKKCSLVIEMEGNTTIITDPETGEKDKFEFNYSYWSHQPGSDRDATQETLFNDLGELYLNNAWQGYNASLFAYGQTGSGKSFSMMGPKSMPGLIPKGCAEIFERIKTKMTDSPGYKAEVQVSYLEIYNEKVKDLLGSGKVPKRGLRIREHPKTGPYVVGLTKHSVASFADVEKLMMIGQDRRVVAATAMNKTSSRSHSIFTIILTQDLANGAQKQSKINLIDLAGSERADKTGATGARFQEGIKINQSLSALGNCIKDLSIKMKKPKHHVRYRDSVLTRLLQDSLGGNSKTIMLAALSPASDNYEETLTTLRYAQRVASITNKAKKNQTSKADLERELRATIAALREQLLEEKKKAIQAAKSGAIEGGAAGAAASAASSIENMKAMHDNLVHTSESLKHLSQTQDDRIQQTHAFQQQQMKAMEDKGIHINELAHLGVDGEAARLVNISADPSLSGTLVYFVDTTKTVTVGTARGSPKPDIILSYTASNSIKPIHAIFTSAKKGGPSSDGASKVISAVSITPADTLDETLGIFVNGRRVSSKYRLWHGDRIVMGKDHMFQFVHPSSAREALQPYHPLHPHSHHSHPHHPPRPIRPMIELSDYQQIDLERKALQDEKEALSQVALLKQELLQKKNKKWRTKYKESLQAANQLKQQMKNLKQQLQSDGGGDANSGRAEMETLKQQLEEEKKEIHAALTTAKSENQELKSTYEKAMQEAQELQRIEMEALRAENERLKRHHQQAAKLAAFPFPEAKLVDDSSSTTTDSDSSNGDSSGADDYFDFLKNTDDYGYGSGSYNDGNDSDTTSSSGGSVDMSGMEEWYGIASYYQDDEKEIGNSIKIDYFQGLDATASSSSASPSLSGQVSNMSLTDNKGANSDVNASDNNDYDGDFIMNLLEEATTMNLSDTAENASDSKLFDFVNDDAEQEKQSGSASSSSSSPSASAAFASASSSSLSSSTSVSHKLLVTIKALSKLKHSEGSFYAKLQAFTEDGISLFERRTTSQVLSTSGGNVVLNETFDLTTVLKNMAMKAGGVHLSSLEVSVYFEDTAKSALLYLGLGNEIVGSTTVRISDIPVAQVSEQSHDISVPIDPFDDVDAGGDAGPTGTVQIAFNRLSVGAKAAPASASASASAAEQKEFQGLFDSDFNPLQRKEKLWTMTTRQIKELWDGIDANHDQEISLSEIIKFCKSFFARKVRDSAVDMNMQEAECKAFYLKGKPLTKHLVSLAKEMDRTMDVNQDGQIQKREFILRWNAMSQEYFGQQDSCSIM